MRVQRIFAASALLALTSCGWLPISQPKLETETPKEWVTPVNESASAPRASEIAWQDYFHDARLQTLIQSALDHNLDLRQSAARLEEARAAYAIARSNTWPSLSLDGAYNNSRTAADLTMPGNKPIIRSYSLGLDILSYEVDFWGRVHSLRESALARYMANENTYRSFRISLIGQVANTYMQYLELTQRLKLAQESLASREDNFKIVQLREQAGISSDLDLLQAEAVMESAKIDVATLEISQIQTQNALQLLVIAPIEQMPQGAELSEQLFELPKVDVPSEVLLKRPDVVAAEEELKASSADIKAARAAFFPTISLTAGIGVASPQLKDLFDSRNRTWNFTPRINQPLFPSGSLAANLDMAVARRVEVVAKYEQTIQQAFWEVENLLAARSRLVRIFEAQQAYSAAQTKRLKLAEERYKLGVSNYLEVLDAQRDSFSAQQGSVQARRAVLVNEVDLYKALGGGNLSKEKNQQEQKTDSAK